MINNFLIIKKAPIIFFSISNCLYQSFLILSFANKSILRQVQIPTSAMAYAVFNKIKIGFEGECNGLYD